MSNVYTIFKNDTLSNRGSFVGWLIGIAISFLMILLMYPGEEGMASILNLFDDEVYQALLGDLTGSDPGYALWIAMMFPFISMILFIYSLNSGVKIATQESDKGTGEIIFTVPISRRSFYFAKWLSMIFYIALIILTMMLALLIPINGSSIDIEILLILFLYTFVFNLSGVSLGILLGLITGRGDKGSQIAMLSTLGLYTMQSIGRLVDVIDVINKINVFELYDPFPILLQNEGDTNSLLILFVIAIIGLGVGLIAYENKDLIQDRGVSFGKYRQKLLPLVSLLSILSRPFVIIGSWTSQKTISLFLWIKYRGKVPYDDTNFRLVRSSRTSVFTFWGRFFEKRFPIAADFIYSERRVLLITFWAIVMVYPLQLVLYPGDEATIELIQGFGSGGFFSLFTYGHDLSTEPYLWYVMTQAIGSNWIFFIPLCFHWVKKVTISDAENRTGEILGSQPVPLKSIIFQRVGAILLEIIFIVIIKIFFLVLSEFITGETDSMIWEIIAILFFIPLYYFWITVLISIALAFKGSGVKLARVVYLFNFLIFALGVMVEKYNRWYVKGIFGLYDPVLMIREKSILVNNGGAIIIIFLSLFSHYTLTYSSKYYTWSIYDQDRKISTFGQLDKST